MELCRPWPLPLTQAVFNVSKSFVVAFNDHRAEFLANAIEALGHAVHRVEFDRIDAITKFTAAALSLSYPQMEWWQNYQTHPRVQKRRTQVFAENARPHVDEVDAVITWGSWFAPNVSRTNGTTIPYAYYIDQSRALVPDPAEQATIFPRPKGGNRWQRAGYERAVAVHCMSRWAVEQTLAAHPGLDTSLVRATGWGPCAFDDSAEPDFRTANQAPFVLHVGNDFHRKGADWFVEVAKRVRARRPEVRFVLAGSDQSGRRVEFGEDVEYLGPIRDKKRLLDLFRSAAVFLLPARFDRSPHVLVEALSAGLPIVVSNQGGAPELVAESNTGFAVTAGDIDGYAKAVESIVANKELAREMGRNGKELVRRSYNWRSVAERIVESF